MATNLQPISLADFTDALLTMQIGEERTFLLDQDLPSGALGDLTVLLGNKHGLSISFLREDRTMTAQRRPIFPVIIKKWGDPVFVQDALTTFFLKSDGETTPLRNEALSFTGSDALEDARSFAVRLGADEIRVV